MKTDRAEFERKLARARAELAAKGMWRANADPWPDRWLRRCGLRLRPPHYRDPWRFGVRMGGYFAVAWGLFMWLWVWRADSLPVLEAMASALFAGALFGFFMAMSVAWFRRRHRLTRREDL